MRLFVVFTEKLKSLFAQCIRRDAEDKWEPIISDFSLSRVAEDDLHMRKKLLLVVCNSLGSIRCGNYSMRRR